MGTGITSILLHELPFQFRGLGIISNVIFGLNVLLFFLLGISMSVCQSTPGAEIS
jgi:tellurite resistance protein TehA-like permease